MYNFERDLQLHGVEVSWMVIWKWHSLEESLPYAKGWKQRQQQPDICLLLKELHSLS